ncbi:hypothetical protein CA238_15275 [Sphingomonas koreensis]|nr:hypothetical protein BRX39_20415 [Sphingomonas koreensis]RSV22400.1 hypothetical protein CA238_15275 [Sphingomonas koreensis]RSV52525.1 hypothetical protein CA228_21320 [Sphingomonas koreensis]RSY33023.1 hypothetical protein DAH75_20435 [Sphingomonas koreensis]RSY41152.1 hypothetical protein DAH74_21160 [Sphingomonas koreensis]
MGFGVFITLSIWAEPGSPVAFHGGRLMASGRLQQVLNEPSAAGGEYGPTVGKGFTDKAGATAARSRKARSMAPHAGSTASGG